MKRLAVPLILAMIAGGCARSEDATAPVEVGNDAAITDQANRGAAEQEPALGEWRRALQDTVAALEFGPTGTSPVLSLVCGTRGGLVLQRHGVLASGQTPTIGISIGGGQVRQLPVTGVTGTAPLLRAEIAGGDALIQQMAGAQAPISIRSGDAAPLIVPPSPLIGQFAQECTNGPQPSAAADANADANPEAGDAAAANQSSETNAAAPAASAR